jgi:hypothetical protein
MTCATWYGRTSSNHPGTNALCFETSTLFNTALRTAAPSLCPSRTSHSVVVWSLQVIQLAYNIIQDGRLRCSEILYSSLHVCFKFFRTNQALEDDMRRLAAEAEPTSRKKRRKTMPAASQSSSSAPASSATPPSPESPTSRAIRVGGPAPVFVQHHHHHYYTSK